jgi:hypothetical protein
MDGVDIQLRVAGFQHLFREPRVRLRHAVEFRAISTAIGRFDDPHIRPSRRIDPGQCPDLLNVEHRRRPLLCCFVVLLVGSSLLCCSRFMSMVRRH